MRVAIFGANGQLGREIEEQAKLLDHEFFLFPHHDADITQFSQIQRHLKDKNIDLIINAAAYTKVDAAETEENEAHAVNVLGVKNLLEVARSESIKLVHFSTDFVFDGAQQVPYAEDSSTNPLNVYGRTKLEGETLCLESGLATIIRTSWVYSCFESNFVKSIYKKLESGEALKVVDDQIGRPTYAENLAKFLLTNIESWSCVTSSQIFHFADEGSCSWFEFASRIRDLAGFKNLISPISSGELNLPAKRPRYSCLDLSHTKQEFNWSFEPWEAALARMLKKYQSLR